ALTDGKFPTVKLSANAIPVLKGQERICMKLTLAEPVPVVEENDELFSILRTLRKRLADQEKVPPYVVFADTALREMSRFYPIEKETMLKIKGVGQMKFEKYGQFFIEEIKRFIDEKNIEVDPSMQPIQEEEKEQITDTPSYLISYEYYIDGLSIKEI